MAESARELRDRIEALQAQLQRYRGSSIETLLARVDALERGAARDAADQEAQKARISQLESDSALVNAQNAALLARVDALVNEQNAALLTRVDLLRRDAADQEAQKARISQLENELTLVNAQNAAIEEAVAIGRSPNRELADQVERLRRQTSNGDYWPLVTGHLPESQRTAVRSLVDALM